MTRKAWHKDTKKTQPDDPLDLGVLFTGVKTIPEGISLNFATVPVLDELQEAINSKRKAKGENLIGKLYSSHTEIIRGKDDDGDPIIVERTVVVVRKASMLSFLSDHGPDSTNVFGLTFQKNLGSSIKLPALFHSIYVEKNFEGDRVSGALFEYDPTKRQAKGERYVFLSQAFQ